MGITIAMAAGVMLILALIMSVILGWANKAFAVDVDPKITAIDEVLPAANCGACGFIGCGEYSEGVVKEGAPVNLCPVGGAMVAKMIANIMGVKVEAGFPAKAIVKCAASYDEKAGRCEYLGERTCASAELVANIQSCTYGCIGFGDCVKVCKFDAIDIINGKVVVDYEKCVGCKACEKACPRGVISMMPMKDDEMFVVACNNKDFGKDVKKVCSIGCIGCKMCTKVDGSIIEMQGDMAVIDYDKYDAKTSVAPLQAAAEKCPVKIIVKVGNAGGK
ncbi:MAG: RnfABCDGE type electron transport complex subunit B [Phycisphaerae bacterium]|nr:RnfABCDGE type electron transport complex subunit B [Phycisphaerae bacterium]